MSVVIEGMAEAKRRLADLSGRELKNAERAGLKAGGNALKKATRRRAPRRTGFLARRGISVKARVNNDKADVWVGINRIGRMQELGTRKMPARPFFRPALAESEAEIVRKYGEAIKRHAERKAPMPEEADLDA
jgi:HK97 gp10 family phage protein